MYIASIVRTKCNTDCPPEVFFFFFLFAAEA